MIEFTFPYLFLLLPLPIFLRRYLPPYREIKPAIRAPFFDDIANLLDNEQQTQVAANPLSQHILFSLCWLLLLCALAKPQYIEAPLLKTLPTRDLLLAVDLSGSMDAEDFTNKKGLKVNRLEAVKEVLDEFLKRRKGDRVGLILFGTAPFIQVPFTEDLDVCRTLLNETQVGMAGPQTMLGDAIGLAISTFEQSEVKEQVLILLTDGNDTGSRIPPEEAAKIATEKEIVIHTIAIGDPSVAGESKLDEATLTAIAEITSGGYFHADDRDELEAIYDDLDKLETREVETVSYRPKRDLFHWPLATLLISTIIYHLVLAIRTGTLQARRGGI